MFLFWFLALALFGCSDNAVNYDCPNPLVDSAAVVVCTRVLDGDTWAFELKGEEFKVRCLGFDAFETRRGDRLREQAASAGISEDSALALGALQKNFADSVLRGKNITIVRDYSEPNMDVYGRLLRNSFANGVLYVIEY